MNRREFTQKGLMASALIAAAPARNLAGISSPPKRTIRRGIMWGSNNAGKTIPEKFTTAREAGFDGIEAMSHLDRNEILKAIDASGLPVPSVCGALHWKFLLSDPDPKIREQGVEALKLGIEDAKAYGADTVLIVPGRVTDTVSYEDCWRRSSEELKKVMPLAEKLGVMVAVENVWNNFLLSPMEAAEYVDQLRSPMAKFYFDCGNILAFGFPEQWIRTLGKRIAKVHIKEYSRKLADSQGRSAGFKAPLTEGDVNWPAVLKALDDIGYSDWATIEQPGGDTPAGLRDLNDRLVKILDM